MMGPLFLLKLLGVGKTLLGIGKGLFGWLLALLKSTLDWAGKHPVLAAAILLDVILLSGCFWGYRQHVTLQKRDAQIVQLNSTIKQDKSLIDTLYERVKEYATALTQSQQQLVKTIDDNNRAVDRLKKAADAQLAAAQKQAEKTKRERDYYVGLLAKYRTPGRNCGTAEQRLECEQTLNKQFIQAFQKGR